MSQPTAITYRTLKDSEELRALNALFEVVFEKEKSAVTGEVVLSPGACAIGAYEGDMLVGGVMAYELLLLSGVREFYIYDIAVSLKHQKKGIGTGLIVALREEAKQRGISTIFVEAEVDDDGAVAFYRSLGGEELAVRHFNLRV